MPPRRATDRRRDLSLGGRRATPAADRLAGLRRVHRGPAGPHRGSGFPESILPAGRAGRGSSPHQGRAGPAVRRASGPTLCRGGVPPRRPRRRLPGPRGRAGPMGLVQGPARDLRRRSCWGWCRRAGRRDRVRPVHLAITESGPHPPRGPGRRSLPPSSSSWRPHPLLSPVVASSSTRPRILGRADDPGVRRAGRAIRSRRTAGPGGDRRPRPTHPGPTVPRGRRADPAAVGQVGKARLRPLAARLPDGLDDRQDRVPQAGNHLGSSSAVSSGRASRGRPGGPRRRPRSERTRRKRDRWGSWTW